MKFVLLFCALLVLLNGEAGRGRYNKQTRIHYNSGRYDIK